MEARLLFCILAVISMGAHAEDKQELLQKCERADYRIPRYDLDYNDFWTAYTKFLATDLIFTDKNHHELPATLKQRVDELAKPQYAQYVVEEKERQMQKLSSTMIKLHQNKPKLKNDDLELFANCYAVGMFSPDTPAYHDAVTALDDAISRARFKIGQKEQDALIQQREQERQANESARQKRELESLSKLEQLRQNPPSNSAEIGQFLVTADSCSVSPTANFGLLSVEAQSGSTFLILQATFKNTSSSSQVIVPGSVLIDYEGRSYTFNIIEQVLGDPLEVPEAPINPLISQKVRIIYRIPDEISGKVRWQPGQNPDRLTLKCGVI
jgi:hypothetical protein